MDTVPLITTPASLAGGALRVEKVLLGMLPYVEIVSGDATLVELSLVDAMNLGLQLVAVAGEGMNLQLRRALPQSWPSELLPHQPDVVEP